MKAETITEGVAPSCGTCRFSQPARNGDQTINFQMRWCRWGPPVPLLVPGPQGIAIKNLWPTMSVNDSCGRHEIHGASEVIDVIPGEVKPAKQAN